MTPASISGLVVILSVGTLWAGPRAPSPAGLPLGTGAVHRVPSGASFSRSPYGVGPVGAPESVPPCGVFGEQSTASTPRPGLSFRRALDSGDSRSPIVVDQYMSSISNLTMLSRTSRPSGELARAGLQSRILPTRSVPRNSNQASDA